MLYILTGCAGFLVLHLFDLVSIKRWPLAKPFTWLLGSGLLIYALVMISLQPAKLLLPVWSFWFGWFALALSWLLLIYSLFLNLPFRRTYLTAGVGDELVRTGLYALVRHPGVHWFTVFLFSLVLVTRSSLFIIAAPIFIIIDIALVIVQDKIIFDGMFPGYASYRQTTPMLLPNRQSIKACLGSLRKLELKAD